MANPRVAIDTYWNFRTLSQAEAKVGESESPGVSGPRIRVTSFVSGRS